MENGWNVVSGARPEINFRRVMVSAIGLWFIAWGPMGYAYTKSVPELGLITTSSANRTTINFKVNCYGVGTAKDDPNVIIAGLRYHQVSATPRIGADVKPTVWAGWTTNSAAASVTTPNYEVTSTGSFYNKATGYYRDTTTGRTTSGATVEVQCS